ncbi:fungal-specific transcription factor domain-containing protein [Xylogone sp. PMI_703]|nr:fungal-specific transcription factor domain-containing protein [Xylogone sp. PMI_703]
MDSEKVHEQEQSRPEDSNAQAEMAWVEPDPDMEDDDFDDMTTPLSNIRSASGPFPGPRVYRRPIRRRIHNSSSSSKNHAAAAAAIAPSRATNDASELQQQLPAQAARDDLTSASMPDVDMQTDEDSPAIAAAASSGPATATTDTWRSPSEAELPQIEVDDEEEIADEEDILLDPKPEPLEDEVDMRDLEEPAILDEATTASRSLASVGLFKRPRGRPRKNPLPPASDAKVVKGRSKTGCITCRKRKKKCDEAKPRCNNCEKNAVICEGYHEKTLWRSGKEKTTEGKKSSSWLTQASAEALMAASPTAVKLRKLSAPSLNKLPPVIHGVDTAVDKFFFEHYIYRLASIFTVEDDGRCAFKDMLLPMAVDHLGLMHSILALSSKHMDHSDQHVLDWLRDHPDITAEHLKERSQLHHDEALEEFNLDIEREGQNKDKNTIISARYGQMLCRVMQTLAEGEPSGQHQLHLQGYQRLIKESPPEEGPFLDFIKEFFQYHIFADEIISLPIQGRSRLGLTADDILHPSDALSGDSARLLGVTDGLFYFMSKTTSIRNVIRQNMLTGKDPAVDYNCLYQAAEIDSGIRVWEPPHPKGDSRDVAGLLYKQMMWVYLFRTIYPPKKSDWKVDERIKEVVDDGLKLLKRFPADDPAQTLLLLPAFVIGCAAFEEKQREPIREAIHTVRNYTRLRNSDNALALLERVWELMDAKDERSWDWQTIAHDMGMDFLVT